MAQIQTDEIRKRQGCQPWVGMIGRWSLWGLLPASRYYRLVAVLIGNESHRDVLAIRSLVRVTALHLQGLVFGSRIFKDSLFIAGYAITRLESEIFVNVIRTFNIFFVFL